MIAERELHRKRDEIGADWEIFHPRVRGLQRWSRGRTRETIKPYIAGYVFVRFDDEDGMWPRINWTMGLRELMYSSVERPAPVSDKAMDMLIGMCSVEYAASDFEQRKPIYYIREEEADAALVAVGDKVRWKPSWAAGYVTGKVTWEGGERLRIVMEMFGTAREVELKKRYVEVIT